MVATLFLLIVNLYLSNMSPKGEMLTKKPAVDITQTPLPQKKEAVNFDIPVSYQITLPSHYYQTFNNCGPATLSMALSYYGVNRSQAELGDILRPYQNKEGNNDDKSVTLPELAQEAQNSRFLSFYRPGASIDLVKKFIANKIPVIARTWLLEGDDVGHYRIITGYNDETQTIFQDDSYQGPNRTYSYKAFLSLWQPFNYEYLIIVEKEKEGLVKEILGSEIDEKKAWEKALDIALKEESENPENIYPKFNQVIAHYHLGTYEKSVQIFEQIEGRLPARMLWYQIEPIKSYQMLGNRQKVLSLTESILSKGNRAFSELYQIRGELYYSLNELEQARKEFELAIFYNQNYQDPRDWLDKLK